MNMTITSLDIPILKKYKTLVDEYKKTVPKNVQVSGREEQVKLAAHTMAKRMIDGIISSRCDVIAYKKLCDSKNLSEDTKKDSKHNLSLKLELPSISPNKGTILTNRTASPIAAKAKDGSETAVSVRTRQDIASSNGLHFNFKNYFQKQLQNEVHDAIKMYDHLQSNILQAQIINEKISTIKSFRIKIDKGGKSRLSTDGSGFGIILDPKFNTDGKTFAMKFSYRTIENKIEIIEIPIQSSGEVPEKYSLTVKSQQMSEFYNRHLPGWDGIVPGFIPAYDCQCELKTDDADDTLSIPISFMIFPAASSAAVFTILTKSVDDFSVKVMSNSKVMGGMPLLNLASLQGETRTVSNLLAKGGNPNFRSPISMNTALHEAIYGYHPKILSLLLDMNADQTIPDCKGNTPLHIACSLGYADIVRLLLGNSKVNTAIVMKNEDLLTPLEMCATGYVKHLIREKLHELFPNRRRRKSTARPASSKKTV